ncbi:MAG TPA: SH3 domain-containing protein [Novosphingobium sp.]|nr:SH3 domain-containing protein [Novosphingobium sp.]
MLAPAPPAHATAPSNPPYWASLRVDEVNMRVGPGEDYRINWVYHRAHLPVKVLRVMEGWRLIEDPDGARGWVLAKFLTKERGAYVTASPSADIHAAAAAGSAVLWRAAPGVVGALGPCREGWCHIDIAGKGGFIREDQIWGSGAL